MVVWQKKNLSEWEQRLQDCGAAETERWIYKEAYPLEQ